MLPGGAVHLKEKSATSIYVAVTSQCQISGYRFLLANRPRLLSSLPVRKKQNPILENITVEAYAAEGKSIARTEGKVIFIEKAVPGDVVDVRLTKSKRDWAEGTPVAFKEYAPDRVEPFCQHFGVCGGCKWQMLPYEKQLLYKQQQVVSQLSRIGGIPLPEVPPIAGAGTQRCYRNKLEYTFANKRYLTSEEIKQEEVSPYQEVAGFHAPGIFDKVVDIEICHLQHEPTNRIRRLVKKFAIDHHYPFYDIKEHTGFVRNMQVRLCTTGQLMVNIVFGYDKPGWYQPLLDYLLQEEPSITTLLYTINQKWNDSLDGLQPQVYYGPGYVLEKLEDFTFKIGPLSFFQTNTEQAETLYRITRDFAGLDGSQVVYDLYCGTGSIGIFVSKGAKKIIGVEAIAAAVADATENAALNGVHHAQFFAGDVAHVCTEAFFAEHGRPDVIITDPPRAGMAEKLIREILGMAAPVVVYVSCNPATQARDLKLLDEKYRVEKVQPVDMFPHTHHIENVVKLVLKQ
jgi:23S rRNA (uracil1939-C5)-methyltransferase